MLAIVTEASKFPPTSGQGKQKDYKCIQIWFWEWLICCLGCGNGCWT